MSEGDKLLYEIFLTKEGRGIELKRKYTLSDELDMVKVDWLVYIVGAMGLFANQYIDALPESEQLNGEKRLLAMFKTLFETRHNYINITDENNE